MLRVAGGRGCNDSQLWPVHHAVNSPISDLLKRSHKIKATAEGFGVRRYLVFVEPSVLGTAVR